MLARSVAMKTAPVLRVGVRRTAELITGFVAGPIYNRFPFHRLGSFGRVSFEKQGRFRDAAV
jgi:hypothetical protein